MVPDWKCITDAITCVNGQIICKVWSGICWFCLLSSVAAIITWFTSQTKDITSISPDICCAPRNFVKYQSNTKCAPRIESAPRNCPVEYDQCDGSRLKMYNRCHNMREWADNLQSLKWYLLVLSSIKRCRHYHVIYFTNERYHKHFSWHLLCSTEFREVPVEYEMCSTNWKCSTKLPSRIRPM